MSDPDATIDQLTEQLEAARKFETVFFKLCASLTLADHTGDVGDDVLKALDLVGVAVPEAEDSDGWTDDVAQAMIARGITTLYGTALGDDYEDDEE